MALRRAPALLGSLAALALATQAGTVRAEELPETGLSYTIEATLDPDTRVLTGRQTVRWRNPSDAPVGVVPLHLYMNGFEHADTTWMRGVPAARFEVDEFLDVWDDPWGWIDPTAIRQRLGERTSDVSWRPIRPDDGNPLDRSLISATLPWPVIPGRDLVLEVDFEVRLPIAIARTGCVLDFCLVAQWFPKIAVMELPGTRGATRARWAMHQFHGPTEFYADFADYDVSLTVPVGWTVAATGRPDDVPRPTGDGLQRVRYRQRAVHDFAWLAARRMHDESHRHQPAGGGPAVSVRYLVPEGLDHQVERLRVAVEGALDVLGRRVGPYPYDVLTVTTPPFFARRTSGMEYPTFITGMLGDPMWDRFPLAGVRLPELVAVHEFGHEYFYGLIASEEREEAWLDEGFNSFWEGEIMGALFPDESGGGVLLGRTVDQRALRARGLEQAADRIREPMGRRPTYLFEQGTWGAQSYPRPAVSLATVQAYEGWKTIDLLFQEWYRRGAFHHPSMDDFLDMVRTTAGPETAARVDEMWSQPRVPDYEVVEAEAEAWEVPLGRVPGPDGPVMVTRDDRGEHDELGLDAAARESRERVMIEVTDPGWKRGDQRVDGTIERRFQAFERGDADADWEPGDGWQTSRVRLRGPAWDRLPVEVRFRFRDGVVVRETWDGRAAWRSYRFVRKAPLAEVRVDPEGKAVVDVKRPNDARRVRPDDDFASDWSGWLGALAQWVVAGASLLL